MTNQAAGKIGVCLMVILYSVLTQDVSLPAELTRHAWGSCCSSFRHRNEAGRDWASVGQRCAPCTSVRLLLFLHRHGGGVTGPGRRSVAMPVLLCLSPWVLVPSQPHLKGAPVVLQLQLVGVLDQRCPALYLLRSAAAPTYFSSFHSSG